MTPAASPTPATPATATSRRAAAAAAATSLAGPPAADAHEPVTLAAAGAELAARYYAPCAGAPAAPARGAVLVVGAMGVAQRYYAPFAAWLAAAGYHVVTFDYRGSGASRRGSLRRVSADILTWARHDTAAAFTYLEARAPGLPITWIGHSLGGQIVPFVPGSDRAAKIITVGTGSGYWRQNAAPLRRKVWLFWWGAVPLLTPLFGYFPGGPIGMVGDLPRGVIRQWRRWCLDPEYCVGAEGPEVRERFAAVTTPITSIWFTDDEMMSAASVAALHGFYTGAPQEARHLAPADVGLRRVGHFGFFRAEHRAPLWERVLAPALAPALVPALAPAT